MDNDNIFNFYTGDNLLTIAEDKRVPIIEDFLYENDYVMLVAEYKTGKTIFLQQLACCVSQGRPFLDILDIPNPQPVWYIATEGKDWELQERFINISKGVNINTENLFMVHSTRFKFTRKLVEQYFNPIIELAAQQNRLPKLIIVDSLYSSFQGKLRDDDSVNEFNFIIREIAHKCNAAVMIAHHMKKGQKNSDGEYYKRDDNDTYGSVFLMAQVEHCFRLEFYEKEDHDDKKIRDRYLTCDTQRSGKIISGLRLRLTQPEPLYFSVVEKHDKEKEEVAKTLSYYPKGLTITELVKKTGYKKTKLYSIVNQLKSQNEITRTTGYPARYTAIWQGKKGSKRG